MFNDFKSRDFWISFVAAMVAFLVAYHLPRILQRNV